jgi:hypothetical protein
VVQVRSRADALAVAALEAGLADARFPAGHGFAPIGHVGHLHVLPVARDEIGLKNVGLGIFLGAALTYTGKKEPQHGGHEKDTGKSLHVLALYNEKY